MRTAMLILLIVVFSMSGACNLVWLIRKAGSTPFRWIKLLNAVVSILMVFAYTYVLIAFQEQTPQTEYESFALTILRPLNLLMGTAMTAGAIARMKIKEYIIEDTDDDTGSH